MVSSEGNFANCCLATVERQELLTTKSMKVKNKKRTVKSSRFFQTKILYKGQEEFILIASFFILFIACRFNNFDEYSRFLHLIYFLMASTAFQSQQYIGSFSPRIKWDGPVYHQKKSPGINKMVTSLSNLFEEVVGLSTNLLDWNYKFYVDCVK